MTTRIAERTGDTVFLNVRSGPDVLCIDRKEGTFPIKTLIIEVGNRRPLGVGAGGIALLMPLPDEELERVVSANEARLKGVWQPQAEEHHLAGKAFPGPGLCDYGRYYRPRRERNQPAVGGL